MKKMLLAISSAARTLAAARVDWAVLLLCLGVLRHVPYEHVPAPIRGQVFHAMGAFVMACLLLLLWREHKSKAVTLVVLWWLYEETLVMMCSAWRIIQWWPIPLGQDQCTQKLGYNAMAASLLAIGYLAGMVWRKQNERPVT